MKKVFHLVPILIENSCIVNKKKKQIMTVGEVNSLLVGDLNKFVSWVSLRVTDYFCLFLQIHP